MPQGSTARWCALAVMLMGVAAGAARSSNASQTEVARGRELAFSRAAGNCIACHSLPGASMAGNVGPRLGPWIRRVFGTKQALVQFLYDPQRKIPHVVMPRFGKNGVLTRRQLHDVADYLWSVKG